MSPGLSAETGDSPAAIIAGSLLARHLAGIRVLDNSGDGNADDMIAGLQWIQEHYRRYNIRIVNISAGAQ